MSKRFRFVLTLTSAIMAAFILSGLLSGCAAMQVAIEHKDLVIQNQMSDTIFLRPAVGQKTVFVEMKDTSGMGINLAAVQGQLESRGFQVVSDPEQAKYLLQANVLFANMTDPSAAQRCLANGYGGAIVGGVGGALAGAAIGGSALGAGVGGLVGAIVVSAAETAINSSVKNVTFTVVTDVQISEKSQAPVNETQRANIKQGSSTVVFQAQNRESNFLLYRTRIVSTANQVNLKWHEARPGLEAGLSQSIAGLF